MKTLITLLFACCFGSAMAQSNLPTCEGDRAAWTDCFGAHSFTNGNKYVGDWRNGKGNGQGTYTFANGQRYVGEYRDGNRDGQGTYTWPNGDKYVGEHKDDEFNGQGIRFRANGGVNQSGIWEDGVLVQPKFIDVATFTRIPTLSNSASNLAQLRKTEEQAKQKQAELEAQRKATELALAQATKAAQEQVKLEAQLAAQQQIQIKPAAQIAPQGKRVALVIGNAKYKFSPLNNPVNDATDMAASLRSVGFDVIEVKDANKRQMRAATRRFEDKLAASDVGLVYYSGHGVEVKGRNYLIPVDADIRREHEVEDQAFDAGNILRMMESLQGAEKKRVNIMIVDACRNNDLARSWRSTNRGLARMDAPTGSFISFATAPGQVASDGNGRNSPFTKHLLQALKQPNVPIELVFKEVRRNVMAETGGEQVPWENSSLVGDFYFTVAR
ncbi:caspase family protein [Burkholderiaceae bacterium]|nr:caspase family protein [Burkholderiaceae bacterium]